MLTMLFDTADRSAVEQMYKDWENYRNAIGTGTLDRAFQSRDPALLRDALEDIHKMNRDFTLRAVKRYAEMLAGGCG